MDTPQEVEVWFVLPALRRQFVLEFKKQNMKQKDIAKIMRITEPAVSQYIKNKRGKSIAFDKYIKSDIKTSVSKIMIEKSKFRQEFQKVLKTLKKARFVCSVCHEHTGADKDCNVCY